MKKITYDITYILPYCLLNSKSDYCLTWMHLILQLSVLLQTF